MINARRSHTNVHTHTNAHTTLIDFAERKTEEKTTATKYQKLSQQM